MKKKIKRQKRIVNITMIAPLLIWFIIALVTDIDSDAVPTEVFAAVYGVIVVFTANIVDRCPCCKKYLGFRHYRHCPHCDKHFY